MTDRCRSTSSVHTETTVIRTKNTHILQARGSLLGESVGTSYDLKLYDTKQNETTSMESFQIHPQSK